MKKSTRPVGPARRASSSKAERGLPWRAMATHPALWAMAAALVLYLPSVGFDFVRDDHELIARNPFLRGDGHLLRLLTTDFWAASGQGGHLWRPLVTASFWWDGRLGGWRPEWFHAVNVIAHALVCATLAGFVLASGVGRKAALAAGVGFAVLPALVESVAWISGRTDIFCALFAWLALAFDRRSRRAGRAWPGVIAVLALLLALLSKEAALPLVFVLTAAWWVEHGRSAGWAAAARWLGPYVLTTLIYVVLHESFAAPFERPAWMDADTVTRVRAAGWTMLPEYAAMLWPGYPHTPDRALALPSGMGDPRVLGGIAFAGLALAAVIVMTVRRSVALVPALLALLPLTLPAALAWLQGHLSFAGRLVYLPAGGVAWLLALAGSGAVRRWPAWRTPVVVGVVSWIAASAWASAQLLPSWRNDLSMYGALIRSQPENARGRVGYANQLSAAGRDAEALAELDQAETIAPRMPELHVSRAVIHFRHGRWDRVLQSAERALALDPHQLQAQLLHATALLRLRRLDEAQVVLERLLQERPGEPGIEGIWGQLLLVRGEVSAAIPFLQRAAQWNTDDASVSYALGVACDAVGRWPEAQTAFGRTVEIDPRYYDGWLRLARAAHAAGDRAARDRALESARRLPEASDGRVEALTRAWEAP